MSLANLLRNLKLKLPESFWKEEAVRFLTETKSERIVEVPLILNNIPKKKSRILDIGCRYSILPLQLASLGHKVYGIDIHYYKRKHRNFKFYKGDLLTFPLRSNFFDVVIALSTIEHIGLDFYGEGKKQNGDKEAVEKIHKISRPSAQLLLTVPFGRSLNTPWYRVYDEARLRGLLNDFKIEGIETFAKKGKDWVPVGKKKAEKIDSTKDVKTVVFVLAKKK